MLSYDLRLVINSDHAESISFLEDVRQLVRFQKLPADYYVEIITGMKERKEIKKDQFVSEIDALKHLKLVG
ncbi:hypothetical protein BSL78_04932 [Apostichopus japonicus]|uniref:Uncharacterized protein n=1 Tax=Stichopus japonicus TaxID=307972 RepID=A0A2G8LD13_STIJA|nr:hypothetical protein BSL78_04932 [Apostichopus japonicus]